jgi:hypothetical protein
MSNQYLVGQRVIVGGHTIATVIKSRDGSLYHLWVRLPDGVEQYYALANVEPLPGGQL